MASVLYLKAVLLALPVCLSTSPLEAQNLVTDQWPALSAQVATQATELPIFVRPAPSQVLADLDRSEQTAETAFGGLVGLGQNAEAPKASMTDADIYPGTELGVSLGRGLAAWYQHPGKTASGDIFDPRKLTAAHATLPFGTRLRVVNLRTKKSVVVEVNDRISTRKSIRRKFSIDLSRESAKRLGIDGIAPVEIFAAAPPNNSEDKLASVGP